MLDPRIQLMLFLARISGKTFHPNISLEAMRAVYARTNFQMGLGKCAGVESSEVRIPTGDGEIGARLYLPEGATAPLPVLVYFHGGGFVIGDVACYDHLTRFFCREGQIAVLSVDYRLGPEFRFPHAFEDGFSALRWVQGSDAAYGFADGRIAVAGDSAGGGIAATLSAFAESRGLRRPDYQLLIYPSLDAKRSYPSMQTYAKGYPLTLAGMLWFGERFIHGPATLNDPLFSPLNAPNPEGLPPTYLLAAKYDPLLDEGALYAERLRAAGVEVTYDLRETLPHAFVNIAGAVPAARRALKDAITATSAALAATDVPPATALRT